MSQTQNHSFEGFSKRKSWTKGNFSHQKGSTPQEGNPSPLLSNIMLNELDNKLETRGLSFARYLDECVITVKSKSAAKRVMESVSQWIQRKLGLKVNVSKSKITRPDKLKYLGFGFWKEWKSRPHQDSVLSFKKKLKTLTQSKWSISFIERLKKLNALIKGWINYFLIGSMKSVLREIDSKLRSRLRMIIWKMWKVPSKRQWGLQKLGINKDLAR